jgi:hypothetical protein
MQWFKAKLEAEKLIVNTPKLQKAAEYIYVSFGR